MEVIAQLLFLWAGVRTALAGAFASALGAGADLAATAVLTFVMASIYGAASYLMVRWMRADREAAERRERAAAETAERTHGHADETWDHLMAPGFEADEVACVVDYDLLANAFAATALRLVREGALRIERGDPSEGGAVVRSCGRGRDKDVLGRAAMKALFCTGSTRLTMREALDNRTWTYEDQAANVRAYETALEQASRQAGLTLSEDTRASGRYNGWAVVFVIVGLVGAIWFAMGVPSVCAFLIYVASSLYLGMRGVSPRKRSLTPAGARVAVRLDALRARIERALEAGERIGLSGRDAGRLLEFAVVLDFDEGELAQLARQMGDASLERLAGDWSDGGAVKLEGVPLRRSRLAGGRRLGGKRLITPVGMLRSAYLIRNSWLLSEYGSS